MFESDRPERRRAPRHEVVARARIRHGLKELVFDIVNVSRSGVLVDLGTGKRPPWLEIEKSLKLSITFDSASSVEVHGVVVRIVEDRRFRAFALEFGELSEKVRHGVEQLVEQLGDVVKRPTPPPLPR